MDARHTSGGLVEQRAAELSPVGSKPATCGRFKTSQSVILLGLVGFLLD
jgi:hypothetical protein